jgi:hypothetical protein
MMSCFVVESLGIQTNRRGVGHEVLLTEMKWLRISAVVGFCDNSDSLWDSETSGNFMIICINYPAFKEYPLSRCLVI